MFNLLVSVFTRFIFVPLVSFSYWVFLFYLPQTICLFLLAPTYVYVLILALNLICHLITSKANVSVVSVVASDWQKVRVNEVVVLPLTQTQLVIGLHAVNALSLGL